ncbi:MAG: tetratricopeptide repeat protein [Prevotella sp.]|jgi:tetratricopeptide (TPR) repeat protein|nr:tetratricopeptide repeat protein [Prevotella sp.]
MNFLKALFGGSEENPEEEKKIDTAKQFDMLKYDGVKAMKIGKFDAAVNFFNEALNIKEDVEIHEQLSRVYIALDRMDDALAELDLLSQAMPDNISLPLQMAHVAYMKEDYDQMIDICERALAIDENNSRVHYFYAQALIGKDEPVNAVARLTKAISLDERSGDAHLLRGQTLYKMGDMGGALTDVKWLLDHVQPQEDVMLLAARVMHAGGNDEVAQNLYNVIIEMNPFHLDAYRERGKIRFDKGDKQGAQEDMQKVLELDPQAAADINGDFSAEGIEERVKKAYSAMNPFGL